MAASVVSARIPDEYMPRAIGAAQFTQTPSGVPIAIPINAFDNPPRNVRYWTRITNPYDTLPNQEWSHSVYNV